MNDRLMGQPMPDNTADSNAGGGDHAGSSDRAAGDLPDQGSIGSDSGEFPGSAERPGSGNRADHTGANRSKHARAAGADPGEHADSGRANLGEHAESGQAEPGELADSARTDPGEHADSGGSDPNAQADKGTVKARRRRRPLWSELPLLVVIALVIALLIKTYVVQAFFIPSGSMENTLEIGDKILVNKVVYHLRSIQPGDIIVFNGAGSWTTAPPASRPSSDPIVRAYDATLRPLFQSLAELFGTAPGQTDFIKRVIGVPGDHVACCNAQGLVTVNGVALHEQSYLYPGEAPSDAPPGYSGRFSITVPPGRLWVMGDNRAVSDDSRLRQSDPGHGTIPESEVIGRAFMIVWPPSRWRILPIPGTFLQRGINRPPAAAAVLASGTGRLEPAAPLLPLAAGFAGAVPLTWLQRRLRRRRWLRRRS
jgi:signal peptidase I